MKEFIKKFILFNLAILFYFTGWLSKNNFYLSFFLFLISLILFVLIWGIRENKIIINFDKNIKENIPLFLLKTFIIFFAIIIGYKLFQFKKDLLANIVILIGLIQLAFLFKGKTPQLIEENQKILLVKNKLTMEQKKKIFTKTLIIIFFTVVFISGIFLSYSLAKRNLIFVSTFLLLVAITGFGYFYSLIEKEEYEEDKPLLYNNIWFNIIVMTLLIIIALILRVYKISEIPDGYSLDEQLIGAYAGPVMQNHRIDIFIADVRFQVASLYYYLIGQLWKLIKSSIDNARIISAITGVINIIFIYLVTFELFKNRRIALLSAFFMTFSYYHLIYSRIAWLWIFVPALASITFYFYLLGEKTGKYIFFVLSGIALGINLYFYNAAKMVPFIFVLYWSFFLFKSNEHRKYILNNYKGILIFIFSALIVFIPLGIYILKYPDAYFDRIKGESIFRGQKLANILSPGFLSFFITHAKDAILMFIYKASKYGYYNLPYKPLLDSVSGFLYILGFGYVFYNIRNTKYFLLFLIFLFSLVPAFFSVHPSDPNTQRAILSIVPIIIFISLGAEIILKTIEYLKIKITKILNFFILLIFLPFIIFDNLHTYFNLYKNDNDVKAEFFYVPSRVIKYVNNSKNYFNYGSFFYLETPNFHINTGINFKFFDFAAMRFYEWTGIKGKGTQFILESIYNKTSEIVKEYIPDAVIKKHWDPYSDITNKKYTYRVFDEFNPKLLFISIAIPEESIKMFHSLNVKYLNKKSENILGDIKINMAEIPVMKDAEGIEVTSLIDLPYYAKYRFYCSGQENCEIFIDDKKITGEKLFPAGLHKFKVILKPGNQQNLILNWECREFGLSGKIPGEYFVNSDKIYGLKGEYYIEGEKVAEQIDPIITHRVYFISSRIKSKKWQNMHDIIWTGKIFVPEKNVSYILDTMHNSWIEIDGQRVFYQKDNAREINFFNGQKGWHNIKIYYSYKGMGLLSNKQIGVRFMYKTENTQVFAEVPYYFLKPLY